MTCFSFTDLQLFYKQFLYNNTLLTVKNGYWYTKYKEEDLSYWHMAKIVGSC